VNAAPSPIERFLGPDEARGGPFALLGIRPTALSDDTVIQALHRQLSRVAAHPESQTPAADEVRLALHAAAAQLLDPTLREQMLTRHGGGAAEAAPPTSPQPTPGRSAPSQSTLQAAIEHDAILVLGSFGGWNPRALHRLLSMAHARGASSSLVAATLRDMAGRRGARPQAQTERPAPPPRASMRTAQAITPGARSQSNGDRERHEPKPARSENLEPEPRQPSNTLIITLGVLLVLVVTSLAALLIFWAALSDTGAPGSPATEPAPALTDATPRRDRDIARAPDARPTPEPADAAAPEPDWRDVLEEALEGIAIDPEGALLAFREGVGLLAREWVDLPADERAVAADLTLRFIYRAGRSWETSAAGVDAIVDLADPLRGDRRVTPEQIWPAAWAIGTLTRLSREADLPAAVDRRVRLTLSSTVGDAPLGGTFEAGVQTALTALADPLVAATAAPKDLPDAPSPLDAWKKWLDAVDRGVADPEVRQRIMLTALERLLVEGPDPAESRLTFRAIQELAAALAWSENAPARRWLLRWFVDRRLASDDLHALTSALVSRTRAAGVSPVMVLSAGASQRSRAEMRQTYARAWKLAEEAGTDRVESDWATIALERLASPPEETDSLPAVLLADAVIGSRLNEAAALLWSGRADEASDLLTDLEPPVQRVLDTLSTTSPKPMGDPTTDGAWAIRFREARNDPEKQFDLLNRLKRASRLGPIDAEVLVETAVRSSRGQLRMAARERARALADSPAVVNAVLEELPDISRIRHNAEFIEAFALRPLPPIRAESWPREARRALVERLLELLAAEGDLAAIDQLSELLAASYHRRDRGPGTLADDQSPQPAHESASHLWSTWTQAIERAPPGGMRGMGPDEVERRRQGRLNLARGPVQHFAAEQVSVCELMALVVAREQPAAVPEIRRVLAELADARRHARHIFQQLTATERAITRLWLIRYGIGS